MNLSGLSIRRPVTIVMIVSIIVLLGFISLTNLNIDLFPEMKLPVAAVITSYSGTSPEEIENLVTRPIEEVMGTVSNVDSLDSYSVSGTSIVIVSFDWGTDMDFASLEMRDKVDLIRAALPQDCGDPMIFKMDPSLMSTMTISMSGSVSPADLRQMADNQVKDRLERIAGVASVDVAGGLTREIGVTVRPEVLQVYGLSLQQVAQALMAENMDVSAGKVSQGTREYRVRVLGQFTSVKDIQDVRISLPTGGSVRLGDVADVEDGFKDSGSYSLMNGKPSVALFINKESDANTVEVAREVRQAMDGLQGTLPGDVQMTAVVDQAQFIEQSISSVVQNIVIGGILAVLVLFLFLRNVRSTLIIAIAIPISLIATFSLVYFRGLTLNMMTLGGLALGVGMMVDNSIVILENIFRHRQQGEDLIEAAQKGSSEMSMAITASTLTTVAVFVPIVFVKGLASILFTPLALTVSFSLLASLFVALTLVPMLASRMLTVVDFHFEAKNRVQRAFKVACDWLDGLSEKYGRLLKWALGHKKRVLLFTGAMVVVSLLLIPVVGMEFLPSMDEGLLSVSIELPHGSKIEQTERIVDRVLKIVDQQPEVDTVFESVGSQMGQSSSFMAGDSTPEYARIDLQLVDKDQRRRSTDQVGETIRNEVQKIAGAKFTVSASDSLMPGGSGGTGGSAVSLQIKGDDLDTLRSVADDISDLMKSIPGTREVSVSMENSNPEIQVDVDRSRAAAYGLTVSQVGSAARAALDGQVAARYQEGGDEFDIRVHYPKDSTQTVQDLKNLKISTPMGVQVPLGELGDVHIGEGPIAIERQDQVRTVTVNCSLFNRSLSAVQKDLRKKVDAYVLPPGYTIDFGGQTEQMTDAFGSLGTAFVLAVILVFMILAAQFESYMAPLAIMFAVPVTIVGVVLGLLITFRTFNVPTFIGVIMLAGIVVNNAIVLIDYVKQLRAQGYEREEAILIAGPTRLRPVLMTALTTILAMVPLAIGIGQGSELRAPMATAVIGGLLTSTLLTLVVVPVMYVLLDDAGQWMQGKVQRALTGRHDQASL